MLSSISWKEYICLVAIVSTMYYIVIYLKFYKISTPASHKLKSLAANGSNGHPEQPEEPLNKSSVLSLKKTSLTDTNYDDSAPPWDEDEIRVYPCTDELNSFFNGLLPNECSKEEVIRKVQIILKKYPKVETSTYKDSVSALILMHCEEVCSFHLNEEEVVRIWCKK